MVKDTEWNVDAQGAAHQILSDTPLYEVIFWSLTQLQNQVKEQIKSNCLNPNDAEMELRSVQTMFAVTLSIITKRVEQEITEINSKTDPQ